MPSQTAVAREREGELVIRVVRGHILDPSLSTLNLKHRELWMGSHYLPATTHRSCSPTLSSARWCLYMVGLPETLLQAWGMEHNLYLAATEADLYLAS